MSSTKPEGVSQQLLRVAFKQNVYFKVKINEIFVYNSFRSSFQAQELRRYLKSNGAEISEEKSSKGIEDDLHKIIGVCDVCFKDGDPVEIDAILNSIVSIMVTVSSSSLCSTFMTQSN